MTKPHDTLSINELIVHCIIGVSEQERQEKQPVKITITLSLDTQKAARSDSILDTVNYHELVVSIEKKVSRSAYFLLEKLAQTVSDICLKDKRIKQVIVAIEKPNALKRARSAAIEIIRTNE